MKNGGLCLIFVLVCLILIENVFALGVGPAKVEYNFEPGMEQTINYFVLEDNPSMEHEISLEGDLAPYVRLDRTSLVGADSFNVKIKLPERIEKPGKHTIFVVVAQKIDPELIQGAIGTSITMKVVINIYVPYPGRYLDIDLRGQDVNVGDPLTFELNLESKGEQEVTVTPYIEVFAGNNSKEVLPFNTRTIKSQEKIGLQKVLDTSSYNPGVYKAIAIVDYGVLAQDEVQFRVGELRIDIINYTKQIEIDKIEKFELEIQSGWNDPIDGAYADVTFFNSSGFSQSFRTTTSTLTPWENKKIESYFDTSNFSIGFYNANVTLSYFGKNSGKSSSLIIQVEFIEKKAKGFSILLIILGGSVFVVCAIILLILKFFRKNGKRKK